MLICPVGLGPLARAGGRLGCCLGGAGEVGGVFPGGIALFLVLSSKSGISYSERLSRRAVLQPLASSRPPHVPAGRRNPLHSEAGRGWWAGFTQVDRVGRW